MKEYCVTLWITIIKLNYHSIANVTPLASNYAEATDFDTIEPVYIEI